MTGPTPPEPGRRERKKAATRRSIATAALTLFLERGFDAVGVKEIAELADVSVTTLFAHFPSKEAMVFDEDTDREQGLIAAVRDHAPDVSMLTSLRAYVLSSRALALSVDPEFSSFVALVDNTPALQSYAEEMWLRHHGALAAAIESHTGADTDSCRALARFVLDTQALARGQQDPQRAVNRAFDLLEQGWRARDATP